MASTLPSSKKARKFHRKSRYGCLQCKQRRTKCDETRPTCNNCALRNLDCSLQKFESATSRQLATTTNRNVQSVTSLQWTIFPTVTRPSFCRSNTRDLEVYTHFQTNTAGSLYHHSAFKDIYRLEFPRLAQSFPFVGRGLLSIAYVHLASLSREPTPLLVEAAFHVNQALPQYLETLKDITQENSTALFAFATLVVLFTLANTNEECGALLQTARVNPLRKAEACRGLAINTARVIHAHHNIFGIFWRCQQWISSGPLAAIIQRYTPSMLSEPSIGWIKVEDVHLARLSRLWEDNPAVLQEHKWALSDSLTSLRDTFAMVTQLTILSPAYVGNSLGLATIHRALSAGRLDDLPSVMTWYIRLSPAFVSMVEQASDRSRDTTWRMLRSHRLSYGILALITSATALSSSSGPGPAACSNLTQSLGSKIVVTNTLSSEYTDSVNTYFNTEQSKYKPSCIVYPTTAEHVSTALKAIRASDSRFAIKAGGHNPNDFYSSVDKGVLLDLSDLNEKSYDEDSTLATYGPGGDFGDVYDYFLQWNRTVVGARLAGVGTGLALGGGLSYLSSQYGLACDSFRSLEVVLPSGEIVTASEDTNADLFYGLRGGGGNAYGVVTKYTVQSVPANTFYAGIVVYLFQQNSDVLDAISNFIQHNTDPKAAIIGTYMKLPTPDLDLNLDEAIIMFLVYDGTKEEAEEGAVFKNFTDIPHLLNTQKEMDYSGVVNMPIPGSAELNSGRNQFRVTVHGGDEQGIANLNDLYSKWRDWSDSNKGKYILTSFDIQPIPKSLTDASNSNFGGNAMQMPDGPWYWVNYLLTASPRLSEDDLSDVQASYRDLVNSVPATEGLPLFINDAAHDQDPLVTYGGYEKLKKLKGKVDPDGFFANKTGGWNFP
ncbi:hypothetical protein BDV06DRAFT_226262 [Aspergillus oleicola]